MFAPWSNEFGLVIGSEDAAAVTANLGESLTPGNNTYGDYAQLLAGASVTHDVYEILINANSGATAAAARDMLMTIGLDPAGGTSYTDTIEHLLVSCAGEYVHATVGGGGVWYRFPLFIKAGTSIGAKASVNNATVGTVLAQCWLYCQPSHPHLLRVGSFVRSFGATTASSSGTAVTVGTGGTDGTYVQLGSALAEPLWYWEYGIGVNDATMSNNAIHTDIALGSASAKKLAIVDAWAGSSASEVINKSASGRFCQGAVGDLVYGRAEGLANDSNTSLMAYGVGG